MSYLDLRPPADSGSPMTCEVDRGPFTRIIDGEFLPRRIHEEFLGILGEYDPLSGDDKLSGTTKQAH